MPSSWGSDLVCVCGLTYRAFRTEQTFASVRKMMLRAADEPSDWLYKRRGGILGYWHELKVEAWNLHTAECFASAPESVIGERTCASARAVRPLKGQVGASAMRRRPPRRGSAQTPIKAERRRAG